MGSSQRGQGVDTVCGLRVITWWRWLFDAFNGLQSKVEVMNWRLMLILMHKVTSVSTAGINNHYVSCHIAVLIIVFSNFGTVKLFIITILPLVVQSPPGIHEKVAHCSGLKTQLPCN